MIFKFTPGSIFPIVGEKVTRYCDEEGKDVLTLIVPPLNTCLLVKVESYTGHSRGFKVRDPNSEEQQAMKRDNDRKAALEIDKVKSLGFNNGSLDAEYRVQACLDCNQPYVDLEFPPCDNSIGVSEKTPGWLRPLDYLQFFDKSEGSKTDLILNGISPNDIDQGMLGDCWFCCSLASIAEFPDRIINLFRHPKGANRARREREIGAVLVLVRRHGWTERIYIDTYVPVYGNKPCFAKNKEEPGELWVILLEKAYAKLVGSYNNLTCGDSIQALRDLTGYPSFHFGDSEMSSCLNNADESKDFFKRLLYYDSCGYLISFNTPGIDGSKYLSSINVDASDSTFAEKYKAAGMII